MSSALMLEIKKILNEFIRGNDSMFQIRQFHSLSRLATGLIQFLKQRLRLLQVLGVEASGEPPPRDWGLGARVWFSLFFAFLHK
jgi:hypothetical protein